jgi:creatinine amidohydrolase
MRFSNIALVAIVLAMAPAHTAHQTRDGQRSGTTTQSVLLEDMAWTDAERHLVSDAIVMLPLGAAAKEHGPHLKLRNDLILADYLTKRVMAASAVVVAPALTYHFYPAFLEYHGSTSLALATARDMTADVVRSLARYGPRRFYVLNTGISTLRPLAATAKLLASEGILLHYTDLEARIEEPVRAVQQQPGGTHADEIETSMMLYIDPSSVDMAKAVRDYRPAVPGLFRLTRDPNGRGTYSRSGIWGDPTLATREKGRIIVEALVAGIVADLDALKKAPLPQAVSSPAPAPPQVAGAPGGRPADRLQPNGCSAGDERSIRSIGQAFTLAWTNQDAEMLSRLWAREGDIAHPDGSVERTAQVIHQNRAYLFSRVEYRASRHSLGIGHVRCLTSDVAVADGKWDLREVTDANRRAVTPIEGLCTLVLKRGEGRWYIEAYRYTITPRTGGAPSFLRQPGFIDK